MARLSEAQDSAPVAKGRRLRDTPVKPKMIAAFLLVGFVGCIAAGIGIRHIGLISDQVEDSTEIAIPMSGGAALMGTTVREAQVLALAALESRDLPKIAQLGQSIDAQERLFLESLHRLEQLVVKKGLALKGQSAGEAGTERDRPASTSADKASALQGTALTQATAEQYRRFTDEIRQMIKAHVSNLQAHSLARQRLAEFKTQAEHVRASAQSIAHLCERSFAANEESAKTRVQAGKASLEELNEIIDRFFDQDYPLASGAQELRKCVLEAEQAAAQFLSEDDEERLRNIEKTFETKMRESVAVAKRLVGRAPSKEIKESVVAIRSELQRLGELVQAQEGVFAAFRSSLKSKLEEQTMLDRLDHSAGVCKAAIDVMRSEAQATAEKALATSSQTASSGLSSLITVAGIGLVASIVLGVSLAFGFVKPVKELAGQADMVSKGDLSVNICNHDRRDEFGSLAHAMRLMVGSLRDHVAEMNQGIQIISSSSSEIAANVVHVTETISHATASLKEATVTAEQLRHTANVSNDTARRVSHSAKQTVEVSQSGLQATQTTVSRMKQIENQMASIGTNVVSLSEQSQAIEAITVSVRDIADQSNLLAVNASIEAARAGDQGKGFGVVALEIKELADESKQAADRIMATLHETRKAVSATVMAAEHGNKAVEAGLQQSVITEEAIKSLSETVVGSAEASAVIEASSGQQLAGSEQMFLALAGIEQAMRRTLEGSEQLSEEAKRLEGLAARLREMTARFSV